MINILTDSTADLPEELRKKYQIDTIPMYVQINGQIFKDGNDIVADQLFEKVRTTGQYPTTSAPSPGDFIRFFDRNNPSIYIGVSSKLSTTFQNAQLAAKELGSKTIDIVDSLSFSTGYGQIVLQAAEWRNAGMDFELLGQRIRDRTQNLRGVFILESLDYLFHGGRCSAVDNFVSSVLKIRPILTIQRDGNLGLLRKVHGSRTKAVKTLLSFFKEELKTHKIKRIFLTHLDCDSEMEFLKDEILKFDQSVEILTANVGCVLATHSGPKPLGIAYTIE